MTDTALVLPEADVTPLGVSFGELDLDTWTDFGRRLQSTGESLHWAIGDWMSYGMDRWAEKATQAAATTGLANQTIANAMSVARRVPIHERVEGLSFSHHAEVAAVRESHNRRRYLRVALEEGLSRNALRTFIAQEKLEREAMDAFDPAEDEGLPPAVKPEETDTPSEPEPKPEPRKPDDVTPPTLLGQDLLQRLNALRRLRGNVWVRVHLGTGQVLEDAERAA